MEHGDERERAAISDTRSQCTKSDSTDNAVAALFFDISIIEAGTWSARVGLGQTWIRGHPPLNELHEEAQVKNTRDNEPPHTHRRAYQSIRHASGPPRLSPDARVLERA